MSNLDSEYAEFSCRKCGLAIPMFLVLVLISYISYQFFWVFLSDIYVNEGSTLTVLAIRACFLYFSTMTYVFLLRTFITNPGYVPSWLKTPLTSEALAPMNLVRIYNMRFWMANKIHSFDEFADQPDIEISLGSSSQEKQSLLIFEESTDLTSRSGNSFSSDVEMQPLSGLPKSIQNHAYTGSLAALRITPSNVVDLKRLSPME